MRRRAIAALIGKYSSTGIVFGRSDSFSPVANAAKPVPGASVTFWAFGI